ncbi:MAG: hypothetical protein PVI90_17445 [Desulfobacteraceae bacterium]|jgi:hypothetical protein
MSFISEGKRFASGRTEPGTTSWVQYGDGVGIYVDVDTSAGRFTGIPVYTTSLGGNSSHWSTSGGTSVYDATATGFRIYVKRVDGNPITPEYANQRKWHINWTGVEIDE